jgi:hypothetical protein
MSRAHQILNLLTEAENGTVMFFDPDLASPEGSRKNVIVVGSVSDNKLTIVDGETWVGGSLEGDVIPQVAELVKKWNPRTVYVQDNLFQNLLWTVMKEQGIPVESAGVTTTLASYEAGARQSSNIVWNVANDSDLLAGAGVLLKKVGLR